MDRHQAADFDQALRLLSEYASKPGHDSGCARAVHFNAACAGLYRVRGRHKYEAARKEALASAAEDAPACDCLRGRVRVYLAAQPSSRASREEK